MHVKKVLIIIHVNSLSVRVYDSNNECIFIDIQKSWIFVHCKKTLIQTSSYGVYLSTTIPLPMQTAVYVYVLDLIRSFAQKVNM